MAKDPFSLFIEDSVLYASNRYEKLINETKKIFFSYLNKNKTLDEFKKETSKLWDKVDHTYMKERIKELEDMIEARDLKGNEIINPNAEKVEVYQLEKESKFIAQEQKYKKTVEKYYKGRLKTVNKDYIDKQAYLTDLVAKYDKAQAIVPYHYKDKIHYNTLATYNSMLYNVNLNRAGWNRTTYDANLLGEDLMYLPAHPYACPMCMEFQGKIYSKSGKSLKYPPMEEAIAGGVGHPNCKHQWLIYWGDEMLQEDKYNDAEWEEKYQTKQKTQALQLERTRLKTDRSIYQEIGNQEAVDKINGKLRKINKTIRELNS